MESNIKAKYVLLGYYNCGHCKFAKLNFNAMNSKKINCHFGYTDSFVHSSVEIPLSEICDNFELKESIMLEMNRRHE